MKPKGWGLFFKLLALCFGLLATAVAWQIFTIGFERVVSSENLILLGQRALFAICVAGMLWLGAWLPDIVDRNRN